MLLMSMSLDADFLRDAPYDANAILFEKIVTNDVENGILVAVFTPHSALPLTRHQKVHPTKHPRHVNGGLLVHLTGMLGFAHAYYQLGLRHADGWIGYGGKIHSAKYRSLALMNEEMQLELRAIKNRRMRDQIYSRYLFRFCQGERLIYESDQVAIWMKVDDDE